MQYKRYIQKLQSSEAIILRKWIMAFFVSTKLDMACRRVFLDRIRGPPFPDFYFNKKNPEVRACQKEINIMYT